MVLVIAPTAWLGGGAQLRLAQGETKVTAPAEVERIPDGWRLRATAAASELGAGVWKLRLRSGGSGSPLKARLLVTEGRPIALLPGLSPRHPHAEAKIRGGG